MSRQPKIKLLVIITSITFISVAAFGFIFMMDMSMDKLGNNDCPYTVIDGKICPTDILGIVSHHFSIYTSFSNIIFSTNIFEFIMLIIVSLTLWLFKIRSLLNRESFLVYLTKYYIRAKHSLFKLEKIMKWLSLFENSPSSLAIA